MAKKKKLRHRQRRRRLPRLYASRSGPGSSPGSLHPPPEKRVEEVLLRVLDYGPDHCEERRLGSVEELTSYRQRESVTWVDVVGLHDIAVLHRIGEIFGLHPLALEDVLNVGQRPKLERYGDHQFLVFKQMHVEEDDRPVPEQVAIFLLPGCVLTFQEIEDDVLEPVRERVRQGRRRLRQGGSDYLAYAIVDALVDQFFPVLEQFGERLEVLEEELIDNPTKDTLSRIHTVKKDLLTIRRAAWPHREVVNAFERLEEPTVQPETKIYLRDCYDHAVQILDILETYRDLASGMIDIYLSSVSNRMNEVMKVLTVMASIFIPLTFVAGVYGMNFDPDASPWNMPELRWYWGYPAALAVMAAMAGGLLVFFRRKRWI